MTHSRQTTTAAVPVRSIARPRRVRAKAAFELLPDSWRRVRRRSDRRMVRPRRTMPDVAAVAAGELGDPVALVVLTKPQHDADGALHPALGATFCLKWAYFHGDETPIPLLVVVALALGAYGIYRVRQSGKPFEWSGTVEARTDRGRLARRRPRPGGRTSAKATPSRPGRPLITLEKGDLPAQRLIAKGSSTRPRARWRRSRSRTLRPRAARRSPRRRRGCRRSRRRRRRPSSTRSAPGSSFAGGAGTRADADNAALAAAQRRRAGGRAAGAAGRAAARDAAGREVGARAWSRPRAGGCSRST